MYVTSSLSRPQPLHRTIRITRDACGMGHPSRDSDKSTGRQRLAPHNAQVELRATHNKVAARKASRHSPTDRSSAPTIVSQQAVDLQLDQLPREVLRRWRPCQKLVGGASAT